MEISGRVWSTTAVGTLLTDNIAKAYLGQTGLPTAAAVEGLINDITKQ